jgi:hypothetical protein
MKTTFLILAFLLISLFGSNAMAQSKTFTISGKVISSEESFALEGVSIVIKGTNKYTGTQADGTFSIDVSDENKILIFELKEYETQEISINGKKEYNVVLIRKGNSTHLLNNQQYHVLDSTTLSIALN